MQKETTTINGVPKYTHLFAKPQRIPATKQKRTKEQRKNVFFYRVYGTNAPTLDAFVRLLLKYCENRSQNKCPISQIQPQLE